MNKVATILVGVLAVALIAGTGYLVLRPAEQVGAVGASDGRGRNEAITSGAGWARFEIERSQAQRGRRDCGGEFRGSTAQGQGQGTGGGGARGFNGAIGTGSVNGQGEPLAENPQAGRETVIGEIIELDSEMLVQTEDGDEILIGLGQIWYRDEAGFVLTVGDEVSVEGFYEDGEFKAGVVENLSTGETLTLRDASGRPMWAGRGQGQNRS
ncbi:MAG: hypothetical protein ACP5HM_12845 [Anaerolineae bacterium]